jgi:MSHA type pilus biogenesis protein MshL
MESDSLSKFSVQEVFMKYLKYSFVAGSLLLLILLLSSCATDTKQKEQNDALAQESTQAVDKAATVSAPTLPASLPVRYQTASYVVDRDEAEDISIAEESKLKVGARITSTRGPQPLWDIVSRLASLKNMNVSWASDVDKNVLVDVNIGANDDFFTALDNMLRQVDYYHEMQGSTIVVKYRETKQFQISMPFTKQNYSTGTGGNVLGNSDISNSIDGTISLKSESNEFDIWDNIKLNLDTILQIWTFRREGETVKRNTDTVDKEIAKEGSRSYSGNTETEVALSESSDVNKSSSAQKAGNVGGGEGYYIIDKPVGLITVTAPRPVLEKIDAYITTLKKSLYQQIAIEAKIIEVQLDDHSSIGLNWNQILENLTVSGGYLAGETYSKNKTDNWDSSNTNDRTSSVTDTITNTRDRTFTDNILDGDTGTNSTSNIVNNIAGATAASGLSGATIIADGLNRSLSGAISLAAFSFDSFLNAVSEQGQTNILSNPKLSVLNGQPALMTVGKVVTYLSNVTADINDETGTVSYTSETERALSGIGLALTATILDNNQIILNLVPVTSELAEPIEYRQVGLGEVGLPVINIRQMSTTVRVNNGEMLVVGGLISNISEDGGSFIPGTKNIPVFKYLFGYEEKTTTKRELIILLRPRII